METIFPEDLTVLSLEDLQALHVTGLAEFDSLYPTDQALFAALPAETVETLSSLTAGLKLVTAELAARGAKQEQLAGLAAERESFATVSGTFEGTTDDETDAETDGEIVADAGDDAATPPNFAAEVAPDEAPEDQPVAYATGEGLGVPADTPLTWDALGVALDKRISAFNATPYAQAAAAGNKSPLKTTQNFARFTKNIPEDQMVRDNSKGVIRLAVDRARDVKRLKGGSLIASGGWGAPSQISYDRWRKLSSRDGIATFPEIGVEHGGLQIPHGSTFAEVYASPDFIAFTEQQDIDGNYAPGSGGNLENPPINIPGTKPVYRIPPTEWVDHRLKVDGIHVQAGILENRGYPEGIAAELAQVLDAHAHVINAKVLAEVAAGSTAVNWTAGQLGAVAPVLTAVDLQVVHYRDIHRMAFGEELEAKFPNWLKAVFRADLARRMHYDSPFEVNDAQMDAWFRDRGVSVEWVYDWQSVAGTTAANFKVPPTSVAFLLYAAGTWIKGVSDVISLDTMYDSTLLGTNDYTIMFTEEGWFVAKAGPDSRLVTVPMSATGVTHIGDDIANSGAAA